MIRFWNQMMEVLVHAGTCTYFCIPDLPSGVWAWTYIKTASSNFNKCSAYEELVLMNCSWSLGKGCSWHLLSCCLADGKVRHRCPALPGLLQWEQQFSLFCGTVRNKWILLTARKSTCKFPRISAKRTVFHCKILVWFHCSKHTHPSG